MSSIQNPRIGPAVHAFEIQTENWWGDDWSYKKSFCIDVGCTDDSNMPNAPLVAYIRPECNPKEAAALLRELAAYLDSDSLRLPPLVLPSGTDRDDIGESEKRRHALRVLGELEAQAAEIRESLYWLGEVPF
jgi:hypothetical protein